MSIRLSKIGMKNGAKKVHWKQESKFFVRSGAACKSTSYRSQFWPLSDDPSKVTCSNCIARMWKAGIIGVCDVKDDDCHGVNK